MAVTEEIARLKEQAGFLEAELQREQQRTRTLQAEQEQAGKEVAKLQSKLADASSASAKQAMANEQDRLKCEAATVAAARAKVEALRATAAGLLAEIRDTKESAGRRISENIAGEQRASDARMGVASSTWHCEKEVLDQRVAVCKTKLASLHTEVDEARCHARRLKRRTAIARLGRAAACWRHEHCVQELQQKARRERAVGLRKLAREGEKIENEVTCRREALNKAVRLAELEDEMLRKDRKAEITSLRDELGQLEDHIESVMERMRHQEILSDTVAIVPIEEGDRIRKWAEANAGSSNFRGAAHRLHMRSLMPGLDGDDIARNDAGSKLRGTSSAPSLPSLRGGLQGLDDRIQGCRRVS